VARASSYVQESPGAINTLVSDDPNGMKTIFWLNGAIGFIDDGCDHRFSRLSLALMRLPKTVPPKGLIRRCL